MKAESKAIAATPPEILKVLAQRVQVLYPKSRLPPGLFLIQFLCRLLLLLLLFHILPVLSNDASIPASRQGSRHILWRQDGKTQVVVKLATPLYARHLSCSLVEFLLCVSGILQHFETAVIGQVQVLLLGTAFALSGQFILFDGQRFLFSILPVDANWSTQGGGRIGAKNDVVFSYRDVAEGYHCLLVCSAVLCVYCIACSCLCWWMLFLSLSKK